MIHRVDLAAFIVVLAAVLVETTKRFTIAHPFLLSDNRHITFYIWKNILSTESTRYMLIPGYILSILIVIGRLSSSQSALWIVAFVTCVCLALVPSPLIELRYFIVPYMFVRLHVPPPKKWALALEFGMCFLINFAAFGLFFTKEFTWPDTPGTQRIMW